MQPFRAAKRLHIGHNSRVSGGLPTKADILMHMDSSHVNLARFDLVSIRLAVACAQTGSLTSAARRSHLALAAASRRIRELEEAIGDALFERHARGMVPTAAGRVLVRHGVGLLQSMEQLGTELADLRQGIARHVRLAASSAAISQFLPPLLAAYAKLQSQVHVDLEELVSSAVVNVLREGRAELGVFVEGPDTSGLVTYPFRSDQLVLVLPKGHPLGMDTSPLPFVNALDDEWISLTDGAAMLQQQQQAAQAANRPFRLRMQVRSFDAVCHLVASGLGLAVLPKAATMAAIRAMGLTWRPLSDAWSHRELLLAIRAGEQDSVVEALVSFLVKPSQVAKTRLRSKQ